MLPFEQSLPSALSEDRKTEGDSADVAFFFSFDHVQRLLKNCVVLNLKKRLSVSFKVSSFGSDALVA